MRGIQEIGKEYPINGPWRVLCELFHLEGTTLKLNLVEKEKDAAEMSLNPPKARYGLGVNAGKFKEANYRFTVKKHELKSAFFRFILRLENALNLRSLLGNTFFSKKFRLMT